MHLEIETQQDIFPTDNSFISGPNPDKQLFKVGSRRVIQWAALIMIVFGLFCKFGAVFVTIPTPIVGGLFMVMFGLVSAVGLSNLQVGWLLVKLQDLGLGTILQEQL